jgi:hypothetical protein
MHEWATCLSLSHAWQYDHVGILLTTPAIHYTHCFKYKHILHATPGANAMVKLMTKMYNV